MSRIDFRVFWERHQLVVQALEDAIRLIRLAAEEMMLQGRVSTVRHWLDALPDERVRADGELATYKGWVLALNAEMPLAEEYADVAETCLRQGQQPAADLGKVLVLRSFITLLFRGNYEEAIQLATDALEVPAVRACLCPLWTSL